MRTGPRRVVVEAMGATTRHRGRWGEVATQFLLVLAAALFYFMVRGATQGSIEQSEENARSILRLERWLGLDLERGTQELVGTHDVLITVSNWVYIWGHWPVLIGTLYALHRWRPLDYLRLRNALFVSGAIGMIIYATFPVAPPRLLDPQFRDTVTEFSRSYRVFQPPALVNKYAAMPSLHAGWNLLAGIAIFRASRKPLVRALGVAGPIAMAFAVVSTGNHFVLDVVGGAIVALTGSVAADRWWPKAVRTGLPPQADRSIERGDEAEIVDDQPGTAHRHQLGRASLVVDGPGAQMIRHVPKPARH
jgi:membrane-associated phospholipid phosphatase